MRNLGVTEGVVGFLKLVNDYRAYAEATHRQKPLVGSGLSRSSWCPPSVGCWRINTDAVVLGEEGTGLGVVIRDEVGSVVLLAVKRVRA